MTGPEPTDIDKQNAATRAAIARRFQEEWDRCADRGDRLFGPGWQPSHRHFLCEKEAEDEARRTGARPVAAATVYTVKNDQGDRRHFVLRDGEPVEVSGYEEGFGDMLLEPHPTRRIEVRGEMVAPHRYALCWAAFHSYRPRSAAQLAEARVRRQEKATDRLAEANPLFSDEIRATNARPEKKGNRR